MVNRIVFLFVWALVVCQGGVSQNRNNPNLSPQRINELMKDSSIMKANEQNAANNVPAGIKYSEIRTVDPANPPVVVDIARNITNQKVFKLSDIASSVRYIMMQSPPDIPFDRVYNIASDNERIYVTSNFGLFCYSNEGQFLFAPYLKQINSAKYPQMTYRSIRDQMRPTNTTTPQVSIPGDIFSSSMLGIFDLLNGKLVFLTYGLESPFRVLNMIDFNETKFQTPFFTQPGEVKKTNIEPTYQRVINRQYTGMGFFLCLDDESLLISNTLTTIALNGDTLCKYNDYDQPTIQQEARRVAVFSSIYRIDGHVMLQKSYNDTVFRVLPPNRLQPAYVMNWGKYKPDINQYVAGWALEGTFVLGGWIETMRFIFIHYTEGRDYPIRRNEGTIKDHWAIFDKTKKTLTHYLFPGAPAMDGHVLLPPLIENDIEPIGMPFYPKGVNHKGEMYMTFTKLDVKKYIDSGKFQKEKLQAIYDSMTDDSFCLMLVK